MPPINYRGRRQAGVSSRPRRNVSNKPFNERLNLSENAKKYFTRMLKQTVFAVAVVLVFYIVSSVTPNFWSQISPPINSTLSESIDIVGVYNNVVGRFFPNAIINRENNDDESPINEYIDTDSIEAFRADNEEIEWIDIDAEVYSL